MLYWVHIIRMLFIAENSNVIEILIRSHTFTTSTKKWPILWPHQHPSHHPLKWIIDLLFKNSIMWKHVTNFKTLPHPFHLDTINVWFLKHYLFFYNGVKETPEKKTVEKNVKCLKIWKMAWATKMFLRSMMYPKTFLRGVKIKEIFCQICRSPVQTLNKRKWVLVDIRTLTMVHCKKQSKCTHWLGFIEGKNLEFCKAATPTWFQSIRCFAR